MESNIYHMNGADRATAGIDSLPADLLEAVNLMQSDELVKATLGSHIMENYVTAKIKEWDDYRVQVYDWELKKYLRDY